MLGMEEITFGTNRIALAFGKQKINLHEHGCEFEPKASNPTPGSADLCFIVSTPMDDIIKELQRCGMPIIEGPVERTGAIGTILSVYIRDPDNNLVEHFKCTIIANISMKSLLRTITKSYSAKTLGRFTVPKLGLCIAEAARTTVTSAFQLV